MNSLAWSTTLALVASFLLVEREDAPRGAQADAPVTLPGGNRGPRIVSSLAPGTEVRVEDSLAFELTVSDPDGDPLTVRALDPPPGLVFHPVAGAPSPARLDVRWDVPRSWLGLRALRFEATDAGQPPVTRRFTLPLRVRGQLMPSSFPTVLPAALQTGDVTGDGVPDVVAAARLADRELADVGEVYVWSGGAELASAPSAVLRVPGAFSGDQLGRLLRLADVTGDGVLDVVAGSELVDDGVAADAGAIYVFEGGPGLSGKLYPRARLGIPGAWPNDRLGLAGGEGVTFLDLDGDGVLDLLAAAQDARRAGVANAGAVYLWRGGAGLSGDVAPTAVLSVPGAVPFDRLGHTSAESILIGDVTGDGADDLVVGTDFATVNGASLAGAVYVWSDVASLAGEVAPVARLVATTTSVSNRIGFAFRSPLCFALADLSGDGVLDVFCGSEEALPAQSRGGFYVWRGGDLSGDVLPTAMLLGGSQDAIGSTVVREFVDVTGDGVLDVVLGGRRAHEGASGSGVIYVWRGGSSLSGNVAALARLRPSTPQLGLGLSEPAVPDGLLFADFTGDGVLDVLARGLTDVAGVQDAGALYVWAGGAALSGVPAAFAELTVPGAASGDSLALGLRRSVRALDVDGDGAADLVAGAPRADVAGRIDLGAAYLWLGGPGLASAAGPDATFLPPTSAGSGADFPSFSGFTYPGTFSGIEADGALQLADVTGDGRLDLLAASSQALPPVGFGPRGAVYVWSDVGAARGVPAPSATLRDANSGGWGAVGHGTGMLLVDVTADGVLDVVVPSPLALRAQGIPEGRVYVFAGGPSLAGAVSPTHDLIRPGTPSGDLLGITGGESVLTVDVTGDGLLDLVVGASYADAGGVQDVGIVLVWPGPSPGTAAPIELSVPGASAGALLGGW